MLPKPKTSIAKKYPLSLEIEILGIKFDIILARAIASINLVKKYIYPVKVLYCTNVFLNRIPMKSTIIELVRIRNAPIYFAVCASLSKRLRPNPYAKNAIRNNEPIVRAL